MAKIKVSKVVSLSVLAFIVVLSIAANIVLGVFADTITRYLFGVGTTKISQATLDEGTRLSDQIADEGVLLLKNKDNALPIEDLKKINVFGWASTQVITSGTGSGNILTGNEATVQGALQSEGITLNPALWNKYTQFKSSLRNQPRYQWEVDWKLYEPALSSYTAQDWADYKAYSNVAMFVIARLGGEDHDLPVGYLTISETESSILGKLKQTFGTVIVVVNTCNAMELGFADDEGVDAVISVGTPGQTGINSMAKVLTGKVNPSGRTVDTYAYDSTSAPAYKINEFGETFSKDKDVKKLGTGVRVYSNMNGAKDRSENSYYLDCNEGIYVGYRYYETRYAVGSSSKDLSKTYEEIVQYPFGYGLSYTDFEWRVKSYTDNTGPLVRNGKIKIEVEVKNVGNRPGKDVVQVYYTAPYKPGGVEKSYVELIGFAKTKMLDAKGGANDREVVSIEFDVRDMASYDEKGLSGYTGYVLEDGQYSVRIMRDAHNVPFFGRRAAAEDFVIDYTVKSRIDYKTDSVTDNAVKNRFVGADTYDKISADGSAEQTPVKFLSRNDWAGTFPAQNDLSSRAMTDAVKNARNFEADDTQSDKNYASYPTFSKSNGLHIDEFKDTPYILDKSWTGPTWDDLIDQMSLKEAVNLVQYGGHNVKAVPSIGKSKVNDMDGPQGLNVHNTSSVPLEATAYPSPTNVAQTWSLDLAYKMGVSVGKEGRESSISGWYAPGVNIHRSPYSGRNFEYYSEDPLISGLMGATVVKGASDQGMYCYVKHFAVNDVETWRAGKNGLYTWASEQAMRQIYLKPFELTVKKGGTMAIMSSFNRIGATWAGGSYGLLTEILRDEWGFKGTVVTDYYMSGSYPYMRVSQGLRAGGDLWLAGVESFATAPDTATKTDQWVLRRAVKNILYTYSHSDPVAAYSPGPIWWIYVSIVEFVLIAGAGVWTWLMWRKKKKDNDNSR